MDEEGRMKDAGFDIARLWRVAAYALIAATLMLLYLRRTDFALFAFALGVSAWFLNVRTGIKRKHDLVKDGGRNWRPRAEVEARYDEEEEET
jgi:hypothetical protein